MQEMIPYPLVFFLFIVVPFRATCYYFHGWGWNLLRLMKGEKLPQYEACKDCPYSTGVDGFHRYFARLAFVLVFFVHFPIAVYHILIPESQWVSLFSVTNVPLWISNYLAAMSSLLAFRNYAFNISLFNVTELLDTIMLMLYVFSCHAIRFSFGSGDRKISQGKKRLLEFQTKLNNRHGEIFWLSLFTVSLHSILIIGGFT